MNRVGSFTVTSGLLFSLIACSSDEGSVDIDPGPSAGAGNTSATGGTGVGLGGSTGNPQGGGVSFGGTSPTDGGASSGAGGSCASQNAQAKVLPVYLAFTFDVSGSMGKGDAPWHDRTLKWDPVVSATKAFFQDPASDGLSASLTFFPSASDRCEEDQYDTPDVPITTLPSATFGTALDRIGAADWRGGTPTLPALRGVIGNVEQQMQDTPGRYVIVLVTDGYPQGCDDNSIDSVVQVVSGIAARIPTYVVGVKNPPLPDAPDTVTDLNAVAVAGGTERAYIIDTGNPTQTTAAFKATIDAIRGAAISCDVAIPAPPDGSVFDKQRVAVTYGSGTAKTPLAYDADCAANNAWHYDNPAQPTRIELCPASCAAIQADPAGSLQVEFTCQPVIDIPR